ncbi:MULTISPECIES: TonB-dependent receptor [Sphingomonadales]|uniref:Outer membrane receptor proteins, mostly Fe transport n=3 Tax=Sphingomonadaceae TaxID=41297 RepID=A0A1T5GQQ7_9SPHN|nr:MULTISPECIES: TonB-dependent receptor [Sphingomonadaceae]EZP70300.1 TonB-denpendent receptor [Sphingomonas paucimobilis]MCB4862240.1 TonB-dependent receptor [Sphingobium sp. PNB]SKB81876.1 Outer membrane receptor proteins, mostly Fe transport [Sphingopyxis flava]SKC10782.1 Outer membrane receptor proteins, mostly Fe transport [Rhizorhabdus histidinilytica]
MVRCLLWGVVGLAALSWSGFARAQERHVGTYSEIIVTGEKARRSLQDTPSSVAVTTARRIEEENLLSLQEVYARTANVTETFSAGGFTIRGIADRGIMGGEGAALATIFVDGAAVPAAMVHASPADMWDVRQVEIMRGPQSTLLGLNALAGAVIMRTAEPTMEWELRARAMITDADETQFAAALGGPIVSGELAFRVSVEKRDADGFTWNPTRRAHENPLDTTQVRAKLLWTPTAVPGFEARFGYTRYDRYSGYSFSFTDTSVPDFFDRRWNFSDSPNDSEASTDIATADLRFDLGAGLSLTAITAFNEISEFNRSDNDMTAADGGAYDQQNRYRTFSQELRLNYEGDRLSGLMGAFFYDRRNRSATASDDSVPTPVDTISALLRSSGIDAPTAQLVAGLYSRALAAIPVDFSADASGHVRSYALFGDVQFRLTERLMFTVGFRYDHETNSLGIDQTARFAGAYPDPRAFGSTGSPLYRAVVAINQGVAGIVAQASGSAAATDRTFDAFLPKAGIQMAWTPNLKTGFTVQRGYRSGGSSGNIARSATFSYDPEFTWNYELSLRSAWLDGRLTLNANAFYVDWKDQQVSANFGMSIYDTHIVNAGSSHLYGFEIEATHSPSGAFDWYASVGYSRTRFDEFATTVGSVTDYDGLEFAHAPRWTLAGGVNIRPVDRVAINLNASHRSAVFTEVRLPQSASRASGRTLVNARVAYETGHWTMSAFASNLFDDRYYHYRLDGLPRAVLGNPRVLGIALEARW